MSQPSPTLWGIPRKTAMRLGGTFVALITMANAAELGLTGFSVAFVVAFLPLPVYVWLALWLDRLEPEPRGLLRRAFAWGAVVAVFFSLVVNSVFGVVTGSEVAAAVISAPIVEEATKGLAILLLFRQQKDEFDNVTDGLIYACMVGLGFSTVENVLYYGRALAEGSVVPVFVLRGMFAPFSHPLFTALTGIGFGIARETRRPWLRYAAPLAGLSGAMLLHSLWNLSASAGAFFGVYFLVMVPAFAAVLVVAKRSRRREAELLREHLSPFVAFGVLRTEDVETVACTKARRKALREAERRGGKAGLEACRAFHLHATELAFHRCRVARAGGDGDGAREEAMVESLRASMAAATAA